MSLRRCMRRPRSGDPLFSTTLMAFDRTREQKLTTFYGRGESDQILQAQERAFASLALPA